MIKGLSISQVKDFLNNMVKEERISLVKEILNQDGLEIKEIGPSLIKKWPSAQTFFLKEIIERTNSVIKEVLKKEISKEEGIGKLLNSENLEIEISEFSDKGKSRLRNELNRSHNKYCKEVNMEINKFLKIWE